jgi:hypothetical protein
MKSKRVGRAQVSFTSDFTRCDNEIALPLVRQIGTARYGVRRFWWSVKYRRASCYRISIDRDLYSDALAVGSDCNVLCV